MRCRLIAAACVAALLAGCTTVDTAQPPVQVTEDYEQLQAATRWAKPFGDLLNQALSWCGAVGRIDQSRWADHKQLILTDVSGSQRTTLQFSKIGYDPAASQITYGTAKTLSTELPDLPGHDYIYDLRNVSEPGEFSQTDKIELNRSRSVSITKGLTVNASVESETTIGGSYAGVSLEQKIKATLGVAKTTEETRAAEASTSITAEHTFSVPLAAGKATRIHLSAASTRAVRPIDIDAVATWSVTVTLRGEPCVAGSGSTSEDRWWETTGKYFVSADNADIGACWNDRYRADVAADDRNWWAQFDNRCSFSIPLDETGAMFSGQHVRWLGMQGWLARQPASYAADVASLTDPSLRGIRISGIETTVAEHTVTQRVTEITDVDQFLDDGAKACPADNTTC